MIRVMIPSAAVAAALVALTLAQTPPAGETSARPEGEKAAPSPLVLEAVEITPPEPGVDTLCRLMVKIRNGGGQPASSLHFAVSVAGQELPVYDNQVFMQPLPPEETTEVSLYNFWTTETGRAAPADGKLAVEVTLEEARWLKVERDEEGVEVWQPLEPVPGLPLSRSVTLNLRKPGG